MTHLFERVRHFFSELRRRNVYRVAVTYAAVGFVVIEAADLTFVRLGLPGWTVTLVVVLVGLGFPIALVLAWALEVTPEGVQVEEPEGAGEVVDRSNGFSLTSNGLIVGLLVLVAGILLYPRVFSSEENADRKGAKTRTDTAQAEGRRLAHPASRERPFVAVLPLENLSPKEENQFFADGIHEEILGQLAKVSGLGVKSRTSVLQYEDTEKTMEKIARELDVQALMEGSVRRAGDRVRITTQLIDAETGDHLWSETYERDLSVEAVFDIQADIAEQVASALETELAGTERRRIEEAPTSNLAAYEAYVKGRSAVQRFYSTTSRADLDQAIQRFREAIRKDPGFAVAHARLADAYRMYSTWFSTGQRWLDSARAALTRARTRNRRIAQIHWVQGFILVDQDSLEAGAAAFRRALDLQPSNAVACSGLSSTRSIQGQLAAAVRWAHRAYRLEPDRTFRRLEMGIVLQDVGMLDAATDWFRLVRKTAPENALGAWRLTDLYLSRGKVEKAYQTVETYRSRRPNHPMGFRLAAEVALHRDRPERAHQLLAQMPEARRRTGTASIGGERMLLGLAKLRSGNREGGRTTLQRAVDSTRGRLVEKSAWLLGRNHLWLARGLAVIDQPTKALSHIREAMDRGKIRHQALRRDPFFERLRSDPRFQEILRQMMTRQEEFRETVRKMNIDLYPPDATADLQRAKSQSNA